MRETIEKKPENIFCDSASGPELLVDQEFECTDYNDVKRLRKCEYFSTCHGACNESATGSGDQCLREQPTEVTEHLDIASDLNIINDEHLMTDSNTSSETDNSQCSFYDTDNYSHEDLSQSLKQTKLCSTSVSNISASPNTFQERALIEDEIKRKYQELDEIIDQINTAKRNRRRRRKYNLRKYDVLDEYTPSYVNIYPIKRRKRSAQPIRDALLIRSAMKKAWTGIHGSCCGKGCWAKWQWINLNHVISDYE